MDRRWVSRVLWIALLLSCACLPSAADQPAVSQEPPTSLAPTEDLFSARRIPDLSIPISRFPGNATVITAEEIQRSHALTIPEVLSRLEGVSVSDQQGFGLAADGTVNLRGIVNSSRTNALVLVDGVRQNRVTGDEVHWQSIPVDTVDRIEILRGGSGLIYGEGALAGVINIITKHGGQKPLETEAGVDLGSFGWQQYHTAVRGRLNPATYGVSYVRRFVDGYRTYSASRNTTINVHTGIALAPILHTQVNLLHSEDTTEFPGGLTIKQVQQNRRQHGSFFGFNENGINQLSLDLVTAPWAGLSTTLSTFWRKQTQSSEDSFSSNTFEVTPSQGLSVRSNYEWTGASVSNLFVNGVELVDDKATTGVGRNPSFGQADSESNRKGFGLYAEDTLTLWERVSLVGGLRFDKSRYEEDITNPSFIGTLRFDGFSPKVGVTVSLVPKMWDAFSSFSRPFKAPNVDDFSAQVPSFPGNVNLQPQQADAYELGTRLTHAPFRGAATWFYTRIHDEILVNGFQNQNFDTRRVGAEFSGKVDMPEHGFHSYLTYTFVDAIFRKGQFVNQRIPGTPAHTITAGMGVSPLPSLWVDLDWRLIHDAFRINDLANILGKAQNYNVLDLLLQYDLPMNKVLRRAPAMHAYFKIENLGNKKYVSFESSNGTNLLGAGESPMPPISYFGGLNVQF